MSHPLYVVVVHLPSDRGFTLDRSYQLRDDDLTKASEFLEAATAGLIQDLPAGVAIVSTYDGWLPTGEWQRPAWIAGLPCEEFKGYWLDKPEPQPPKRKIGE